MRACVCVWICVYSIKKQIRKSTLMLFLSRRSESTMCIRMHNFISNYVDFNGTQKRHQNSILIFIDSFFFKHAYTVWNMIVSKCTHFCNPFNEIRIKKQPFQIVQLLSKVLNFFFLSRSFLFHRFLFSLALTRYGIFDCILIW